MSLAIVRTETNGLVKRGTLGMRSDPLGHTHISGWEGENQWLSFLLRDSGLSSTKCDINFVRAVCLPSLVPTFFPGSFTQSTHTCRRASSSDVWLSLKGQTCFVEAETLGQMPMLTIEHLTSKYLILEGNGAGATSQG